MSSYSEWFDRGPGNVGTTFRGIANGVHILKARLSGSWAERVGFLGGYLLFYWFWQQPTPSVSAQPASAYATTAPAFSFGRCVRRPAPDSSYFFIGVWAPF